MKPRPFRSSLPKIESDANLQNTGLDCDSSTATGSDLAINNLHVLREGSPWWSCSSAPLSPDDRFTSVGLEGQRARRGPSRGVSEEWGRTATPNSVASSGWQYAEPTQTLIFLDWDDTLFPCTDLFDRWNLPRRSVRRFCESSLSPELESDLGKWRLAAQEYLSMACALSDRCVIVTNSSPPWVESCVHRFAPNLLSFFNGTLRGPRVVYAGETLRQLKAARAGTTCCCPVWWQKVADALGTVPTVEERRRELTDAKLTAMRREAVGFYSRYPGQTWKNIISLGDMRYERDAVVELSATRISPARERLRTKALVLPGAPTTRELTLWLRFFSLLMPVLARFDGDVDLDLGSAADPVAELARALSLPLLAGVSIPQLKSAHPCAPSSDSPGLYRLLHDARVEPGPCRNATGQGGAGLSQIPAGMVVEVLEVAADGTEPRPYRGVRSVLARPSSCAISDWRRLHGRIAQPPGWILLLNRDDGQRWAEKEDDKGVEEALDEVAVVVQDALVIK